MPSVVINSGNIGTFYWKATLDIYQRKMTFDISGTTYQGAGQAAVLGVAFAVQDQDGVDLAIINWASPQIPGPISTATWVLDLSNVNYAFLFQNYKITAAIQDAGGIVYTAPTIYKTVCMPVGLTESGYVPGIFKLTPNCPANVLTVNEFTLLVYNGKKPQSVAKAGTLNYPTGTIAAVNFTGTPFNNNQVYTGAYQVRCTTTGTYYFQDDFYIIVTYITAAPFNITCATKMADLLCCIEKVQQTYLSNCDNAKGQNAKQLLDQIDLALTLGFAKETNGQDSSREAEYIRKTLDCDCGINSLHQNEINPVNTSLNSIVIVGVNGTGVAQGQNGNTVTYTVDSSIYQIVKGDAGDLSYSISVDNTVPGITKYLLTFNPNQQAVNILNAISANSTLQDQLNSLITNTGGGSIVGLNGKCVIDLTESDYTITQLVANGMTVSNIVINGTVYMAPSGLSATDVTGISTWLNGLTLGTFSVSINSLLLLIQTLANANAISTITFSNPSLTVKFSSTNATLVQVLQAVINYICGMTALQLALGNVLTLCQFDYSGNVVQITYTGTGPNPAFQSDFNAGVAASICNLVARINTLNGLTCAAIKLLFPDNPGGVFGGADRVYGTLNGGCAGLTDLQIGNLFIAALGKYTELKTAFCAIDCTAPGSCPAITNVNSAATSQTSIGFFGVTFGSTTSANQTITLMYRVSGTTPWTTASNSISIFPNGNVNGTSPFPINGLTQGVTYDISVSNNCGGVPFVTQVTTPANPVYSGNYLLDNIIYNICGDSSVVLYSSVPFAPGVQMFSDIGLTAPQAGFVFIAPVITGVIYNINSTTGVVGSATGNTCSSGTPDSYILGNDSSTICPGGLVTLYTSGAFAIGKTLYIDSALTTRKTGFTFVVLHSNAHIYNLDTSTGVVGSDTGLSCTPPSISGKIFYDASGPSGTGTITASIGQSVTVHVAASGPPGHTHTLLINVLTIGVVSATDGTNTMMFTMPSPGSVGFVGTLTSGDSFGSGSVSVS